MQVPAFLLPLVRRYPCLVCRKRAAIVKPGFCPVSGQAGICPIAAKAQAKKAAKAAKDASSVPLLTPEHSEKEPLTAPRAAPDDETRANALEEAASKLRGVGLEDKAAELEGEAASIRKKIARTRASAPVPAPLATPLVAAPLPAPASAPKAAEEARRSSLVLLGRELLDRLELADAEKAFQGAIEENVNDWRGYHGKAEVQVAMGKHLRAFGTCRLGMEKCPSNTELCELQKNAQRQYKEAKNKPKVEEVAPVELPGCPGSVMGAHAPPVEFKKWEGRIPDAEERYNTKMLMLSIFREQWERINKEKEKHAKAAKAAVGQYNQSQLEGLSIKGGHQPMPRPEGIKVPPSFRQKVGVLSSKELGEFGHESSRLLISLYGDIFDVSDRPDKYGAEGPYYFFAGRDITWGLITGADTVENCNIFYDIFKMDNELTKQKMQCICSWIAFYEVEYGEPVGRLEEFENELELPQPPEMGEACVVQ